MALFTIVIIIALIVLAVVTFKFLAGMARTAVTWALLIIAAIFLIYLFTGYDVLGINHTIGAAVSSLVP